MKSKFFVIIALIFLVFGIVSCENNSSDRSKSGDITKQEYEPLVIEPAYVQSITFTDSIRQMLLNRGRKIAGKAKVALLIELKKALKEGGYENAIGFCSNRALAIMDSIGKTEQVMIKRLAKKNRNPYNAMLGKDSIIFKSFVIQNLTSNYVPAQVSWDEEGRPVYYKPIVTESACLNCHGNPDTDIQPGVLEKINEFYPEDKAVDFKIGYLRGMFAITFPEYKVVKVDLQEN